VDHQTKRASEFGEISPPRNPAAIGTSRAFMLAGRKRRRDSAEVELAEVAKTEKVRNNDV